MKKVDISFSLNELEHIWAGLEEWIEKNEHYAATAGDAWEAQDDLDDADDARVVCARVREIVLKLRKEI